jgi:hypothetical protein
VKESEVYNQIFGINWFSFLPESVLIFILCIATLVQGIGGWDPNKILESLKVVPPKTQPSFKGDETGPACILNHSVARMVECFQRNL